MDEHASEGVPEPVDPRIRFAAERTLLAWIRTGLAMMGFGFVVARFGMFLRELSVRDHGAVHPASSGWSVWIGTSLIGLGVAIGLFASYEYSRFSRLAKLGQIRMPRTAMFAGVVAMLMAVLGAAMAFYFILLNP